MNSKKVKYKNVKYYSMNSKNSKTSDLQRLLLNLTDKINLKICCFIKSWHILYMGKYEKVI